MLVVDCHTCIGDRVGMSAHACVWTCVCMDMCVYICTSAYQIVSGVCLLYEVMGLC